MKGTSRKISLIILLFLTGASLWGQRFPEPMKPVRLVNDYMNVMTKEQQYTLEEKLEAFEHESSVQIAVVTLNNLYGLDISDYAARLFENWGIGRGDKNNGILILVKTKTPQTLGQVFISTGYGVEGAVPDALAGRIVDYDMLPAFREGDYYKGIDQAANTLIGLTKGEFTADEYIDKHETGLGEVLGGFVVFIILIVLMLLVARRHGKRGYTVTRNGGTTVPPIFWGGGRGGGGFGGFSGGGGGFGGFGGGSTGGGGAGGSW